MIEAKKLNAHAALQTDTSSQLRCVGSSMPTSRFSRRRGLLVAGAASWLVAQATNAAETESGGMHFPRDHGSHPDFRTEWWYITGHAKVADRLLGFQITFFRSRVEAAQGMKSAFAARQLLFAHAAVTDVQAGRLLHGQRIAREGFGVAEASSDDTAIQLRDWSLVREGEHGVYVANVATDDFALDLRFRPTQPVLLQGDDGISRKGPLADNISHYYSQPQLAVSGRIRIGAREFVVPAPARADPLENASAWLDREWSNAFLNPDAVGWDWTGMNLDDGNALTAFQVRKRDGSALWDGGSFRSATGELRIFKRGETRWQPLKFWTSAASGAVYAVEWALATPAGSFTIKSLVDNQELDSRGSTGAIYWEGLSDLLGPAGKRVGRGYLEMTGYAQALRL